MLQIRSGRDEIAHFDPTSNTQGLADTLTVEQLGVFVRNENTLAQVTATNETLVILEQTTLTLDDLNFTPFSSEICGLSNFELGATSGNRQWETSKPSYYLLPIVLKLKIDTALVHSAEER